MTPTTHVFIGPAGSGRWLVDAVHEGGGVVVDDPADADAIAWVSESDADGLAAILADHPHVRWVQLPWAGVGPFLPLMGSDRVWTCAKGAYGPPVAEHALMLTLACFRELATYARATTWLPDRGRRLQGANVTIVGGGGITRSLLQLLAPFACRTTVVRRSDDPVHGADRTVTSAHLHEAVADADVVVLTLALTDENRGIIDAAALAAMPSHAYLVNVARGAHVDTDALVAALRDGRLAGAGLDVTDPEPLPDDHPLWSMPNVLITPHAANTREMAKPLLAERVTTNVRNFAAGDPLEGIVDPNLGY